MNLTLVFAVALIAWCGLILSSNWYDERRWRHAFDQFEAQDTHEHVCSNYAELAASSGTDQSRAIWAKEMELEGCEN